MYECMISYFAREYNIVLLYVYALIHINMLQIVRKYLHENFAWQRSDVGVII